MVDFVKKIEAELPFGAVVETEYTLDGDPIPTAVSYPGQDGVQRKVKMQWSLDGDLIPETGYTADGDFSFPGQKLDVVW